ncbi:MAG: PQQ-binding-like beta-propeller repeat protein [Verrucomicrobia bacterium]|nr:PQQ-binding-like beta-propeller repeat protein [Verrucomicrobiota bacterium]
MQTFPPEGLQVRWRAPVGRGLSSPVVAEGRVYLFDSEPRKPKARERLHCWDEKTGQPLWTHLDDVSYPDWAFTGGEPMPNSTPIVEAGKVFAIGSTGHLLCLDAVKGAVLWEKKLSADYGLKELWGSTPSLLIEGDLLILVIEGTPKAWALALDKNSGKEAWRALDDKQTYRRTYSSPIVVNAGGQRQLITWTPKAVTALNPATGRTWWQEELTTIEYHTVAAPVFHGDLLLISGLMFQLDRGKPAASVLWPATKPMSKRVFSNTCMPLILNDHVYAGKMAGEFVCLEARSGKQIWETDKVTSQIQGAAIHLTLNGDSVLIFTDEGNLIRARLTPKGYDELSRVHVIEPTYSFVGRKVAWPPPAYANRHVFVRNDMELICASLATERISP